MPRHTRSRAAPGGVCRLGHHEVARVGYGALQLRSVERDQAVALLRRAIDLGIDHIDTAQFYGDGSVRPNPAEAVTAGPDAATTRGA